MSMYLFLGSYGLVFIPVFFLFLLTVGVALMVILFLNQQHLHRTLMVGYFPNGIERHKVLWDGKMIYCSCKNFEFGVYFFVMYLVYSFITIITKFHPCIYYHVGVVKHH